MVEGKENQTFKLRKVMEQCILFISLSKQQCSKKRIRGEGSVYNYLKQLSSFLYSYEDNIGQQLSTAWKLTSFLSVFLDYSVTYLDKQSEIP